jgi:hypothetical protein
MRDLDRRKYSVTNLLMTAINNETRTCGRKNGHVTHCLQERIRDRRSIALLVVVAHEISSNSPSSRTSSPTSPELWTVETEGWDVYGIST